MILEFEDEKRLLDDATRELMQTCSQAAQKAEGVTLPLSVFIRVVDDDEIRAINREQRGKDGEQLAFIINPCDGSVREVLKAPVTGMLFFMQDGPFITEHSPVFQVLAGA